MKDRRRRKQLGPYFENEEHFTNFDMVSCHRRYLFISIACHQYIKVQFTW